MIWILVFSNRMDLYENKKIKEYIKDKNIKILDPNYINILTDKDKITYFYNKEIINKPQKVYIKTGCMLNEHTEEIIKSFDDVKIINDVDLIRQSLNKSQMANFFYKNNIEHIKTLKMVANIKESRIIKEHFDFPLIIKSKVGSLGTGIYKVNTEQELNNIMASYNLLDNNYQYLIQEYITEANVDYRVMVLGGKISYVLKREAQENEFRSNYNLGSNVSIVEVNKDIQELVDKVYNKFKLNVMGIDLIKKENKYIVCEINSNPGFKGYDSLGNNFVEDFTNYLINF